MTEEAGDQTASTEGAGDQTAGDESVTSNTPDVDTKWYESLPEDQFNDRDRSVLRKYDSVDALARGYMNAFNLVTRDKIPMPKEEGEWQEVYDRLGRPEDASGYDLQVLDSLPPQVQEIMTKNLDWFRSTAYDLGLNSDQASKLYSAYSNFLQDELTQTTDRVEDEMRTAEEDLKREYGQEYDTKLALANRAIDEVGGEPLVNLLEQNGMGRNPLVVRAFVKMGEMMAEETGLDKGNGEGGPDTSSLQDEIASIQADKAYLDKNDPRHAGLVRKMQTLMTRLYPEPKEGGAPRLF